MNRGTSIVVLLACAALFAAGIALLFKLRFEAGDIYPAYSSLRADPLGTMAFYESLQRLPGLQVERDFRATQLMPEGGGTTYLHLAGRQEQWKQLPKQLVAEIERFLQDGGRLVVTLFPQATDSSSRRARAESEELEPEDEELWFPEELWVDEESVTPGNRRLVLREAQQQSMRGVSIESRWGLAFGNILLEPGQDNVYEPVPVQIRSDLALPHELTWYSGTVLTNLAGAWRVIYDRDSHPVVAERDWGRGTIVFATDSWFVSNEALWADRHAVFLTWLVGPNRRVLFDEAHFGIVERPGVAALVRRYRLHGVVGVLVMLAGLFIWKNSFSLAPHSPEPALADFVSGKDSSTGFVSLLRRHIPADRVLAVCLSEWLKTAAGEDRRASLRREEVEAAVRAEENRPRRDRDPTGVYRHLCETSSNRTRHDHR
jgi:hypothetical protein